MKKRILIIGAGNNRERAFKEFVENDCHITYVGEPYYNNYSRLCDEVIYFDCIGGDRDQLIQELLLRHKEQQYDAVLTMSEMHVEITSEIADKLGLPGLNKKSAAICRNKYLMRQLFEQNNLPSPKYALVKNELEVKKFIEKSSFPLVLKPTDNGGSVGVIKINNINDVKSRFQEAISKSFNKQLVIEDYIVGSEYSVEVIIHESIPKAITVVDKEIAQENGHFIEVGHIVPSLINEENQNEMKKLAEEAVKILGINHGVAHVEIKQSNGKLYIIEVGARAAGDLIPDLIGFSFNWNYYGELLNVSLGKAYSTIPTTPKKNAGIVFFIGQPNEKVEDFPRIKSVVKFIKDIQYDVKKGTVLRPLTGNFSRLGHVVYEGKAEVMCKLKSKILDGYRPIFFKKMSENIYK